MAALSRTLGIFGAFVAMVGAAFYPIYFRPLLLPEEYNSIQVKYINVLEEDFAARFSNMFSEVPSNLTNKMKATWKTVYNQIVDMNQNEQSINRAGIVQEDIQPAGLKVWSDPFGRK